MIRELQIYSLVSLERTLAMHRYITTTTTTTTTTPICNTDSQNRKLSSCTCFFGISDHQIITSLKDTNASVPSDHNLYSLKTAAM